MSLFHPLLVPLAPLFAALFTALPSRFLSKTNFNIAWWVLFAGFITSILLLWQLIQDSTAIHIHLLSTPWPFLPTIELVIDRLAAVMMAVISGFGIILYRYSARYMQQDRDQGRYQTVFVLKAATLLFMVSSGDLVTLFMFWQVSGWLLSLLSHNYAHVPTANGAFRTFIFLRAGEMAFAGGVALAYHLFGTVQLGSLFERAATDTTILTLFGGLEIPAVTAITVLIFVGAMSKSAQFPMHLWLPDTLFAPTPVSALLHSGGVNAGGFLLTRLAPLYMLSPVTLNIVLLIGLVTAIAGSSMMLVQNDIKKTLGYSTIGQMGYMIMECGLGAFPLAIFHLIAHGLFKIDLFLSCAKGIQDARQQPYKPYANASGGNDTSLNIAGAFILSLLAPLGIAIGAHELLGIPYLESQGLLILMLFSWVTASQAMLTLFKLRETLAKKSALLVGIALIATGYFFAAEQFTHFLIPNPATVEAYLQAASLPPMVFMGLVSLLVISIAGGWYFSIQQPATATVTAVGGSLKQPSSQFSAKLYLLLLNKLYLDSLVLRVVATCKTIARHIDKSSLDFIAFTALTLFIAYTKAPSLQNFMALPIKTTGLLLAAALLIPMFPLHGAYVAALTLFPRKVVRVLTFLMPILGMACLQSTLVNLPAEFLPLIRTMAIAGALWGTIKALSQTHVPQLLAYGAVALYSLVWWHVAQNGTIENATVVFGWSITLTWYGLFLAWDRLRSRFGNLPLGQLTGLFVPMPYFSMCLGLLIMAAIGLPPFGLFSGYIGMLLSPATGISFGLFLIISIWFASSWQMYKLMQQLVFGPHRTDLHYKAFTPKEITMFAIIIVLLVILGTLA